MHGRALPLRGRRRSECALMEGEKSCASKVIARAHEGRSANDTGSYAPSEAARPRKGAALFQWGRAMGQPGKEEEKAAAAKPTRAQ